MAVDTYIVYPPADALSATLVHDAHPDYKWMTIYYNNPQVVNKLTDGVDYPLDPEPLEIADANLILIGGWGPNGYTKKYFLDTGLITADDPTNPTKMFGQGVYADGQRCITSITRANGTVVTTVFGRKITDTFYAMQDFLNGTKDLLQYAIPIGAGVGGLAIGYLLGRRR